MPAERRERIGKCGADDRVKGGFFHEKEHENCRVPVYDGRGGDRAFRLWRSLEIKWKDSDQYDAV